MRSLSILTCFVAMFVAGCFSKSTGPDQLYVTWDSLEPDKWATVWLIRKINPDADIVIRPVGAPINAGIPFGVPDAHLKRSHGVSLYESVLADSDVSGPELMAIGQMIYDIEIMPWTRNSNPHSADLEHAFRQLQERFPQRKVPVACYSAFFDSTYQLLKEAAPREEWLRLGDDLAFDGSCSTATDTIAKRDDSPFVREMEIQEVLGMIAAGKKVAFVDAREPQEFDEVHIPGAVNMQLRDITAAVVPDFEDADLVVGYCIKDFRGFEVARTLAEVGVKPTAILKPFGLAGWRSLGLPVADREVTDQVAMARLEQCARGEIECL